MDPLMKEVSEVTEELEDILATLQENMKKINEKYKKNQKIRKVSDSELINQFKNEVIVPQWIINDKTNVFTLVLISILFGVSFSIIFQD